MHKTMFTLTVMVGILFSLIPITHAATPSSPVVRRLHASNQSTYAVRFDNTTVGWGAAGALVRPSTATGIVSVATNDTVVLALKSTGGVMAWGNT
ncbi:MAG: hypothetical protein LW717_22700, partial [Chloroflexaceae bacterium]|nr:hypothetical protein [Chloroflexaceae bacterium]